MGRRMRGEVLGFLGFTKCWFKKGSTSSITIVASVAGAVALVGPAPFPQCRLFWDEWLDGTQPRLQTKETRNPRTHEPTEPQTHEPTNS